MWAFRSSCIAALALLACNEPLAPPGGKEKPKLVVPRDAAAADAFVSIDAPPTIDASPPPSFYTVADALADAKASKLERLGIGAWPGNYSIKGCVYKNDRVFVVDVYCTYKEQTAFSVVVISPTNGEVRIYAEANDPISKVKRSDYFSFYAETYPPLAELPAPKLDATFDQVTAWQETSYNTRLKLPAFGACSTDIATCADDSWLGMAKDFVKTPSDDWTWVIDQLRNRAQHDGKYVKR